MALPLAVAAALGLASLPGRAAGPAFGHSTNAVARVVTVENPNATFDFQPSAPWVQLMLNRGLTNFTGKTTVTAAWRSLVSTQDVVGIKVFSAAGMLSGTRPAVVGGGDSRIARGGRAAGTHHHLGQAGGRFARRRIFQARRAARRARGRLRRMPATTRPTFTTPTPPSSAISSGATWNSARKAKASGENPLSPNSSAGTSPKSSASRRC